ncbi:hypothetical protein DP113_06540 [Brasilonema octagenarum UFV-E1]|jgi:hypothetical protein|uniref:Uncharacterized protein n=2 Tax=Bromeliae group (in: Brasilonema) TaxID=3398495 RepID=A0A856M8U0_9CYAN|nr:hypothetical protein DP114_06580 [Brasilonema sennae CENA114]QDL13967.1 hypothetical protein DP113_06540 [Brasilonema octagenarum UFV-E1]
MSEKLHMIETQLKTRLLLALWDLGGTKQEVKKGDLSKRIVTKDKKVSDYEGIFKELEKQGAIAISKKGYSLVSPVGLEVLGEGLTSPEFRFEGSIIGTWAANALLKWISQMNGAVAASVSANGVNSEVKSYDEFKQVALEVYDKLNRDYNLNDLVPIYRIRREVGDRVSRSDFSDWLLEIQENDVFQLMAGEMPDITPDKREDSITIPGGGLRYYAKRLS